MLLFRAEKLALKKSKGYCGAIQFHECLFAAIAQLMYCTRKQFFAGARLSENQHAGIRRRNDRYHAQRGLQRRALSHDFSQLGANFFLQIASLFRLLVSILCRLFVLQCVLNGNRYLTGHLFEQDDVVFRKMIVRTPTEHQNANHAITAYERKIASRPEAFLDHALIKKPAVRIPKDFRIVADLFEAIDPDALAFPQYLTRDRTIHRHQRSLTEGSFRIRIVQDSDTQRAALGVGCQQSGHVTLHYPE
ncbi:MAG TPA: hypothetical protein VNY29_12350 [Terriglobales bacterium]|nr:hypothetical protein [Terriglobales bacterium]